MALIDFARAVDLLTAGEPVGIPTETVYGLAGRASDESTLKSIFTTKRRPFFDPLIVHVATISEARDLSSAWSPTHELLAKAFWPGPLTLVVPRAAHVSNLITSGHDTVGIRSPRHPLALELLTAVGPLAAPSANRFGHTSPTRAEDVELEFGGRVATLDGGPCAVGVESTVISIEGEHVDILRPGGVDSAALARVLGPGFTIGRRQSVRSPGHLAAHYQPDNPVVLVSPKLGTGEVLRRCAGAEPRWLEFPEDPALAARTLYAEFRRLSAAPGIILIRDTDALRSPEFEAIFDRVRRAARASWA